MECIAVVCKWDSSADIKSIGSQMRASQSDTCLDTFWACAKYFIFIILILNNLLQNAYHSQR